MSTTKIRSKKSHLIIYFTLTLAAVVGALYFLFLTDNFPEPTTQIAGTIAAIILLYLAWMILDRLLKNSIDLLISPEKIGFYEQKNWKEVSLTSVNSFHFKNFYNGSKWARKLILELITGELKIIELNGLDTNQAELERILKEKLATGAKPNRRT